MTSLGRQTERFSQAIAAFMILLAGCGPGSQEADTLIENADGGFSTECRLNLVDTTNGIDTVFKVEMIDRFTYEVTAALGTTSQFSITVTINSEGNVLVALGVPEVSLANMLANYNPDLDTQVTLQAIDSFPCTQVERALAYYLIIEWFYYG